MNAHFYVKYDNMVVLADYLNTIKEALKKNGFVCDDITDLTDIDKKDLIVFPMGIDAFKFYWKGYRNFILWQQGATADESFMRHKSKLRYWCINFMDCFAMKKARLVLFVSEYMKHFYEKKAHTSFSDKSYVMPCFNEQLDESVFEKKDYSKKTFAYVGSLSAWQCFEETAEVYKQIEEIMPDAFLKVLTFDVPSAERILRDKNVRNFSVKCVPKEQVKGELEDITYGFLLRRDNEVNRVATPTKISSYLAAGVLPIYSPCLRDFDKQAKGKPFAFTVDPDKEIGGQLKQLANDIDKAAVKRETKRLFEGYYSASAHTDAISALIAHLFFARK